MVEFMERNGDLSKPTGGPRGRHFIQLKWKELTSKLNSEGTGDSRTEEKWRKVWSDLRNNTKKKWAKINRAASGTGGGPALQLSLTDIENRVMHIIGVQAAIGMDVLEAGFQQYADERAPSLQIQPEEVLDISTHPSLETMQEDWNLPSISSQPTVTVPDQQTPVVLPSSTPTLMESEKSWKPPTPKKKKIENLTKIFIETERKNRESTREREIALEKLEAERLRIHEYEVKERFRQRDEELRLQAQWLELINQSLQVIAKYFEKGK